MQAHAKLSASSSHRWMECPGSIEACKDYPHTTSVFAELGTLCHEMAERCLLQKIEPDSSDEMLNEWVSTYCDYINSLPVFEKHIELRLDLSRWIPDGFGTADFVGIDHGSKTLYVSDLKSGKGVKVYAEQNSQLMLYALGAFVEFSDFHSIERIVLTIVQPPLDHIDEWEIPIGVLLAWGEEVKAKAKAALDPNAKRTPGDKQCQWCAHKAMCPELKQLTEETILNAFEDETLAPVNRLSDEEILKVLTRKNLIVSWLSALEEFTAQRMLSGESVTGFKLVEGRSVRQWKDEGKAIPELLRLIDAEAMYTKKLISPAQAEKLLKKNKSAIADLIEKPEGKPTLAFESDARKSFGASIDDFDD